MATAAAASALRIVCVFSAALCGGTRAAPTVTYDQRQNGEFNLQVDVDGVAVVLLPADGAGELFAAQRHRGPHHEQEGGGKAAHALQQLQLLAAAGRAKKKHKKPAAAVQPQPSDQDEWPLLPAPEPNVSPVEPQRHSATSGSIADPYSVTPSTPDVSKRIMSSSSPVAAENVDNNNNMVAVETVGNRVVAQVNELIEKSVIAAVESAGAVPGAKADAAAAGPVGGSVPTTFEDTPISVSSDGRIAMAGGEDAAAAAAEKTVAKGTDGENSNETAAVVAKVEEVVVKVPAGNGEPAHKPPPATAAHEHNNTTVVVTARDAPKNGSGSAAVVCSSPPEESAGKPSASTAAPFKKTPEEPAETTVRAAEKPANITYAAAVLKTKKNPDGPAAVEMVAMKTIEKPAEVAKKTPDTAAASDRTAVGSGGAKPAEKSAAPSEPAVVAAELAVVTRSPAAPKPTAAAELVAVKTIDIPATAKTVPVKVSAVQTKPAAAGGGNAKTTTTNGSAIVQQRKVADRNPLPSIVFEVATPKMV